MQRFLELSLNSQGMALRIVGRLLLPDTSPCPRREVCGFLAQNWAEPVLCGTLGPGLAPPFLTSSPVTLALVFSSVEWDNTALQYCIRDKKEKDLVQCPTSSPCWRNGSYCYSYYSGVLCNVDSGTTMFLLLTETPHMLFSLLEHFSFLLSLEVSFPCSSTAPSQRPFPASPITNPLTLAVFSWRNSALPFWCLSKL